MPMVIQLYATQAAGIPMKLVHKHSSAPFLCYPPTRRRFARSMLHLLQLPLMLI